MMKKFKVASIAATGLLAGGLVFAGPVTNAFGKTGPAATRTATLGTGVSVAPGGHGIASVACPAGKVVSGGGGTTSAFDIYFTDSFQSGNGWVIRGTNTGTTTQQLTAEAICLG